VSPYSLTVIGTIRSISQASGKDTHKTSTEGIATMSQFIEPLVTSSYNMIEGGIHAA
jgi:hypothetical protein